MHNFLPMLDFFVGRLGIFAGLHGILLIFAVFHGILSQKSRHAAEMQGCCRAAELQGCFVGIPGTFFRSIVLGLF